MNIVMVSQALPYLPAQDGFRLYAANMLRTLSGRHRVDLISLMDDMLSRQNVTRKNETNQK